MTNKEFEPIRIRIMKEAYDFADKNDTEGYNSVKVMCSDIQSLMHKEPLTDEGMDILCDAYLKCQEESPKISGIHGLIRAVERHHGIGVEDE